MSQSIVNKRVLLSMKIRELEAKKLQLENDIGKLENIKWFKGHELECHLMNELECKQMLTEAEIIKGSVGKQKCCGIYFLIRNEKVVYIGQSTQVHARIVAHEKQGRIKFEDWAYMPVERQKLDIVESLYIQVFRPLMNGKSGNRKGLSSPLSIEDIIEMASTTHDVQKAI